jgi:hypothetical protein
LIHHTLALETVDAAAACSLQESERLSLALVRIGTWILPNELFSGSW